MTAPELSACPFCGDYMSAAERSTDGGEFHQERLRAYAQSAGEPSTPSPAPSVAGLVERLRWLWLPLPVSHDSVMTLVAAADALEREHARAEEAERERDDCIRENEAFHDLHDINLALEAKLARAAKDAP